MDKTIILTGSEGDYEVKSTHNTDKEVESAIGKLQTLAKENNVNIIAATVYLRVYPDQSIYPTLGDSAACNSTLFIDRRGKIVDFDLKHGGIWKSSHWYHEENPIYKTDPSLEDEYHNDANRFLNTTTKIRTLTTIKGHEFKTLNVICAEAWSKEMWDKVRNDTIDVVSFPVVADSEHDFYKDCAEKIQLGETVPTGVTDIFYGEDRFYPIKNKSNVFILNTDGDGTPYAAVFNATFYRKIDTYIVDTINSYQYVEVPKILQETNITSDKSQMYASNASISLTGRTLKCVGYNPDAIITLYSVNGKKIFELKTQGKNSIYLDKNQVHHGMYICMVRDNMTVNLQKILIK